MEPKLISKCEALFEKYPFLIREYRRLSPLITPRVFERVLSLSHVDVNTSLDFPQETREKFYFIPGMRITFPLSAEFEELILSSPEKNWDWIGIVNNARGSFLRKVVDTHPEYFLRELQQNRDNPLLWSRVKFSFEDGLYLRRKGWPISNIFFEMTGEMSEILTYREELNLSDYTSAYTHNKNLTIEVLKEFAFHPFVKKYITARSYAFDLPFFISTREMEWKITTVKGSARENIDVSSISSVWRTEFPPYSFETVNPSVLVNPDWFSSHVLYTSKELISFVEENPSNKDVINWNTLAKCVSENCFDTIPILERECSPYEWGRNFIRLIRLEEQKRNASPSEGGVSSTEGEDSLERDFALLKRGEPLERSNSFEGGGEIDFKKLSAKEDLPKHLDVILRYKDKDWDWYLLGKRIPLIFFVENGLHLLHPFLVTSDFRIVREKDIPLLFLLLPSFLIRLHEIKTFSAFKEYYQNIDYFPRVKNYTIGNFLISRKYDLKEVLTLISKHFECSIDELGTFLDITMIEKNLNISEADKFLCLRHKRNPKSLIKIWDCYKFETLLGLVEKIGCGEIFIHYVEFYDWLIEALGESKFLEINDILTPVPKISSLSCAVVIKKRILFKGLLGKEVTKFLEECKL